MKRLLLSLLLAASLAACGDNASDTVPAADTAPAAAAPAAAEPAPAVEAPATDAPAATPAAAATEGATDAPAEAAADAPTAPAPAAVPPPYDPATSPKRDVDFTVLATPQPTFGQGGIEVAEVFAYTCIHCANLQPSMSAWKAAQPADVRVEYVPAVFGGVADNFARGFFAAQATGLLDKTHDGMFSAVLVDRAVGSGSLEEIADYYATQGADAATFRSTMESFAVTTKLNRAKSFAQRTGVNATPTMIVNGKYSASMTRDGGPEGLLRTLDYLIAHERAGTTPP